MCWRKLCPCSVPVCATAGTGPGQRLSGPPADGAHGDPEEREQPADAGIRVPRAQDHHPKQWVQVDMLMIDLDLSDLSSLIRCKRRCLSVFAQLLTWWSLRWCGGTMGCTSAPSMPLETPRETLTRKSNSSFTVRNKKTNSPSLILLQRSSPMKLFKPECAWLYKLKNIRKHRNVYWGTFFPSLSQTGWRCCSSSSEPSFWSSSSVSAAASAALRIAAAMFAAPAAHNSAAVRKKVERTAKIMNVKVKKY